MARSLKAPIPDKAMVKLRYCELRRPTVNAGVLTEIAYRANGMFDPYDPVGGHQPLGFDEWMGLYNHFYVIGAKITVTAFSESSPSATALVTAYLNLSAANTTGATSLDHVMELPKTRWKYMTGNTGSRGQVTLSRKFSYKKFFTQKPIDDSNKGDNSADPGERAYFIVGFGNSSTGATTAQTIPYHVKIDYIAVFSERKSLGQS